MGIGHWFKNALEDVGITHNKAKAEAAREKAAAQQLLGDLANRIPTEGSDNYQNAQEQFASTHAHGADAYADPESVAAQKQALAQLQSIYQQGGLTATDRARMQQIRSQEAAGERGNREALLANFQQRGMGGSGASLASLLAGEQGSAQRTSLADANVQAAAQQRALDALQGYGNMASGMRGQSFGEAESRAHSQDALDADNQQVIARNAAAETEKNKWNAGAGQRHFANDRDVTFARAGYQQQNAQADQNYANSAPGLGGAISAAAPYVGAAFGLGSSGPGTPDLAGNGDRFIGANAGMRGSGMQPVGRINAGGFQRQHQQDDEEEQ